MPIKRPCNRPGCPNLVERGYCPQHRPKRKRSDKKKFYDTRRWKRIRKMQLSREPLCELNECCTDPTVASHVHHIDGDVKNNRAANLQSLCAACHTWIENQEGALA